MTVFQPSLLRGPAALAAAVAALCLIAPAADAAAPACTRGDAKLVAAAGKVRVVTIAGRPSGSETRRTRVLGCRTPTGKRFVLFTSRDFGDDLVERERYEIVDDRYIGAIREFEGGVSESRSAATYDTFTRRQLHSSSECDRVDSGDFSGVEDAVFLPRGGLAYACQRLRIADAAGDRELEPPGTDVLHLAVSRAPAFNSRLYWTVTQGPVATVRSLELGY